MHDATLLEGALVFHQAVGGEILAFFRRDSRFRRRLCGGNGQIHAADRIPQIQAEPGGIADDHHTVIDQFRHHCQAAFWHHMRRIFQQFTPGNQRTNGWMLLKVFQHLWNALRCVGDIAQPTNQAQRN
ncbi:hypothetical protein D3C81_1574920 [compost metagenome]